MARRPAEEIISGAARQRFLLALAACGSPRLACSRSGVKQRTAYDLRERDADFAAEWDEAKACADDAVIQEGRRRAFGWEEQAWGIRGLVYNPDGTPVMVKKYDSKLLERFVVATDPAKFAKPEANANQARPADLQPDPAPTPDEPGPAKPVE